MLSFNEFLFKVINRTQIWSWCLTYIYVFEVPLWGFSSCVLFSWLDEKKMILSFLLEMNTKKSTLSAKISTHWEPTRHHLIFDTLYRNKSRKSEIIAKFLAFGILFYCSNIVRKFYFFCNHGHESKVPHNFFFGSSMRALEVLG